MNIEDYKKKSFDTLTSRFDILKLCNIYKCMSVKAQLVDLGYNLNTADKELIFIEIITKNNPDDIVILERYLEAFDLVQEDISLYKSFVKFFSNMEKAEDPKQSFEAFVNSFN